jgi:hypothetical protein
VTNRSGTKAYFFPAAEFGSFLAGDRLHPAEGLLDPLADALADRIARVSRRAAIDSRRASLGVLRDVRRGVHRAQLIDEVLDVVGLVGCRA